MACPHVWTVTSECPYCLRAQLADERARIDLMERTKTYPWLDTGGVWKFRLGKTFYTGKTVRDVLDAALSDVQADGRGGTTT